MCVWVWKCVCEKPFRVCLSGTCRKIPVKTSHGKRCFIWDREFLLSFIQFNPSLKVFISCRWVSAALWCREVCASRRSCFSVCTMVMTWSSSSDCVETVQSTRLRFSSRNEHTLHVGKPHWLTESYTHMLCCFFHPPCIHSGKKIYSKRLCGGFWPN